MRTSFITLLAFMLLSLPLSAAETDNSQIVTADGFMTPGPGFGTPPRPQRQSVGLVLSGGGAKGIAHIGVIKALEDNNIPIDYITGTSMGAIVGGLYASGYSPEEMLKLIASKGFTMWSKGKIDPDYTYYYSTRRDTPSFLTVNLGMDSSQITSVLPVSLINPIPMNYAFIEIFSPYTIQSEADFNKLFVPYRCVTSDVYAKHKVVLGRGSLSDAVRMSMSFPMIFEPIQINGVPMYDGGIYDNYPVDVMVEEFKPDAIIGVNVGSEKGKPDTRNILDQLEDMIMQPDNYPFPTDKGVNIRIDLDEFGLLAFDKYQEIYDIGYKRGLEMIDSIKMKVSARVDKKTVEQARADFKAATPEVKISSVNVSGGTPTENAYLKSFFDHRRGTSLNLIEGRNAYYRAISSGQLQNFVPTPRYNVRTHTIDLDFTAVTKNPYHVGVGGYISTSTNSMLFFNAGYDNLNYKSITADLNAWVGQSYLAAEAEFGLNFNSLHPSGFKVRGVISRLNYHETEKYFYQIHEPDFVRKSESYVRAFYSIAPSLRTEFSAGLGYGHLTDKYYNDFEDCSSSSKRDTGVFNLAEIYATWVKNTYDSHVLPTSGLDLTVTATGVAGKYHYYADEGSLSSNVRWLQANVSATNYFTLGKKFSLGLNGRALLSTRKLLPTYEASIVAAEAFRPTSSSYNYFNPNLSANSFLTAGIIPVWKISGSFQLRGQAHCFLPVRAIVYDAAKAGPAYGDWFANPQFFGEIEAAVSLPFGTISAYGNYTTAHHNNWNFGISIGAFLLAPRFLGK